LKASARPAEEASRPRGHKGCSSVEFEGEGDPILERVKLAEEIIT